MRVQRLVLDLCAVAFAVVLAAPTYAQTTINQPSGDPGTIQDLQNIEDISQPATSLNFLIGQSAINQLNQIGSTNIQPNPVNLFGQPLSWLGVSTFYTLQQEAGRGAPDNFTAVQNAINSIQIDNNALPAVSTVIAGGFQQAANSINSAFFAPNTGDLLDPTVSQGLLTQVVSNAILTATNTMRAVVQNGTARVIGNNGVDQNGVPLPGYQYAIGTLNTAGVLVDVSTTLELQQKQGTPNTVTAINTAIANSIASASGSHLDPSVETLNQDSRVIVHSFDVQSVTTGNPPVATQTVTNLSGFQPGGLTPAGTGTVGLTANLGNVAVAYTGATVAGGNYNIGTAVAGDGIALVTGVTQNTVFALNTITGGPGAGINFLTTGPSTPVATLALPTTGNPYDPTVDGFLQYVDPTTILLKPQYDFDAQNTAPGAQLTGVINAIAARVNNGSASIVGTVRTAPTDPTTQSFTNKLNSAVVGGVVSGNLTQVALNMDQSGLGGSSNGISYTGYVNLAVANANVGPASLTNVSQNMNQSLNTAGSGLSNNLTLNQAVTSPSEGCTLCSNNIQVAAGSTQATITGAAQFINNTVNVAALGSALGSSTITQTTNNVSISGINQLKALTNGNVSINGTQSSFSAINVVK